DELGRQVVGARVVFADRKFTGLDAIEKGIVLGVFDALDQRLVFVARQSDGIGLFAHRYISLRCSMRSKITISPGRSMRQTARQSRCRTQTRSSRPRSGRAAGWVANGSAAKASTLTKSARRSRTGSAAR